ncbi:MAG TPA: ATP-binding protein [Polyangia bacterium]|nr:ATP-binding protein [Polyangia bacterium]
MKLRSRFMLALALAALTPTVLLGLLAMRRARTDLEREVVRGNLALIRSVGRELDSALQDARHTLEVAAAAWAEAPADAGRTRRLLARVRDQAPIIAEVDAFSTDDARAAHIERSGTYGGYVSEVAFDGDRPRTLVVVQARGRTGELLGYLRAQLDLGFVAALLGGTRLGPGAELYVVDGFGRLVASTGTSAPAPGHLLRGRPAVDAVLASQTEGSLRTGGRVAVYRNLASLSEFRPVRWGVVLEQPERNAFALAHVTARMTALVGGGILVLALIAGAWAAARLSRPLAHLAAEAGITGAGDEIDVLAEKLRQDLSERARLEAELVRAEKLSAVGVLAAGVAHEINNPLTTILGYAKLLEEDHPDLAALGLMAEEARRMQEIVRHLLDFSRQEPGAIAPIDLNAAVGRTLKLVSPQLKRRQIDVRAQLESELPAVPADERRLEQVLVNLAQNAAQAMEGGGILTVRTALCDGRALVEFCDTGVGIPADQLPRLFEPFFTTKGVGVGTGLGLAISRQIVVDHGGQIEVQSPGPGQGATFRVLLPLGEAVEESKS